MTEEKTFGDKYSEFQRALIHYRNEVLFNDHFKSYNSQEGQDKAELAVTKLFVEELHASEKSKESLSALSHMSREGFGSILDSFLLAQTEYVLFPSEKALQTVKEVGEEILSLVGLGVPNYDIPAGKPRAVKMDLPDEVVPEIGDE